MKSLFALAATALLLTGCGQNGEDRGNRDAASRPEAANPAASAAGAAAAELGKPVSGAQAKKLMHDRHEGMEEIGDAFTVATREVKSNSPNLARLRQSAAVIARLAPHASGWFPPGTGPDVGKTRAKPEIWQKPRDFAAKAKAFPQAARAFSAAAQRGDIAAIRAAHADLGKACKACHDPYREPEH
ncbi:MAG TPA: cytochrome c [Sphingomicrobium sp.]|nr:cytochrome c [Sphingomicrobium sp.]